MIIKKAVFPVAGFGTRFLPATKATPKEMLPIVDKPLIQYAVEEAAKIGVEEFIFITHHAKGSIQQHFMENEMLYEMLISQGKTDLAQAIRKIGGSKARYITVDQGEPKGLGHAIGCAKGLIKSDEFFAVILADDLIKTDDKNVLEQMVQKAKETQKQVLALQKIPATDVTKYGVVSVDSTEDRVHYLNDIVEKPKLEDAPSDLTTVGRYIFNQSIFTHINDTPGANNEIQITDAIARDIKNFIGYQFKGERFDCGSKAGYVKANVAYGLSNSELNEDLLNYLKNLKNL